MELASFGCSTTGIKDPSQIWLSHKLGFLAWLPNWYIEMVQFSCMYYILHHPLSLKAQAFLLIMYQLHPHQCLVPWDKKVPKLPQ